MNRDTQDQQGEWLSEGLACATRITHHPAPIILSSYHPIILSSHPHARTYVTYLSLRKAPASWKPPCRRRLCCWPVAPGNVQGRCWAVPPTCPAVREQPVVRWCTMAPGTSTQAARQPWPGWRIRACRSRTHTHTHTHTHTAAAAAPSTAGRAHWAKARRTTRDDEGRCCGRSESVGRSTVANTVLTSLSAPEKASATALAL
jgi:hypothetical protein